MAMCEVTIGQGFRAKGKEEPASSSSGQVASVHRATSSNKLRLSDVLLNRLGHTSHISSSHTTSPSSIGIQESHIPAGSFTESLEHDGQIGMIPQAPEWSLLPGLEKYQGRMYHKNMTMAARLLPCWHHEGFFIAKLKKLH